MTRKPLLLIAAIMIAVPLVFAACGDDDEETTDAATEAITTEDTTTGEETTTEVSGGGGGEKIAISETEFALDPDTATVAAGPVTIDVSNDGATVHNLEVEGDGVEEITSDLSAGDSDTLELDLQPGTYEMYCAIGDHRAQGMEGELTVE